jgi:hypothetical protein
MTIKMNKGLAVKYVNDDRVSYYEIQGWSKHSNDKTAEVKAVLKPVRKTVKPQPAVEDAVIMDAFDEEVGIKDELTKGDL